MNGPVSLLPSSIATFLELKLAERIGWTLLSSIWQMALLALAYAVAAQFLRHRSANLRYWLGCLTLVAMLGVPAATFVRSDFLLVKERAAATGIKQVIGPLNPEHGFAASANATSTDAPIDSAKGFRTNEPAAKPLSYARSFMEFWQGVRQRLQPALPWLAAGWTMGVILLALRPLLGLVAVRRLRTTGLSELPEHVIALARRTHARLWVGRAVAYLESALVEVPTVVGYLRPVLLLPASAVTGLTTEQLELVLAHELAHVRRHDYLVNLLQAAIEALLFYHPAMWWVSAQVRRERENCCDDVATNLCGNREQYARALYTLELRRSAATPALAASGGSLVRRIRRLLPGGDECAAYSRSREWLGGLLTLALVISLLSVGRITAQSAADNAESTKSSDAVSPSSAATHDPAKPWIAIGRVTDGSGEPLVGVEIKAFAGIGSLRNTGIATTDDRGNYRLEFGPGIRIARGSTQLQAATIYASKPGYFERNLNRQGSFAAGHSRSTENLKHRDLTVGKVFFPSEPRSIDFVMLPAASLEAELVDKSGEWGVDKQSLYITGDELPPSCNVLDSLTTDERGKFQVDAIPTGREWRIGMRVPNTRLEIETEPVKFPRAGAYRAKLVVEAVKENGSAKLSLLLVDFEQLAGATEAEATFGKIIDQLDHEGFSRLHRAAMGGHVAKVRELLDAGAFVDVEQRAYHGTPLQYAASGGHGETVQVLVDRGATVDARDTQGRTPLAWAAQNGHADVVRRLLAAGAAANSRAKSGWTPLHYAVERGHVESAQLLIDHGADVHAKNSQGKTPFALNPGLNLRIPWRSLESPSQLPDYAPSPKSSSASVSPPDSKQNEAVKTGEVVERTHFPGEVIASVRGQPIFWRDVAPSPEWLAQRESYRREHGHTLDFEQPRDYTLRRLQAAIWKPLLDEYRRANNTQPTEEELDEFIVRVRKSRASRNDPSLTPQTPEEERFFAEWYVGNWKLQQSLYRKYGGRAIYQQVGPEAFDALRDFLKEAEASGNLIIRDSELHERFWTPYLRENPGVLISDPDQAFAHPWSGIE